MRAKIKWWKSLVARPSAADRVLRMERAGPPPTRSHDARRARRRAMWPPPYPPYVARLHSIPRKLRDIKNYVHSYFRSTHLAAHQLFCLQV